MAANCGASEATGKYLASLDGDDAFAPRALDVYEEQFTTRVWQSPIWPECSFPVGQVFCYAVRCGEFARL
jgi:hypothetical protein